METYHKINTLFKRDMSKGGKGNILFGEWSTPELEYLADNEWEFTEKVDGTNIRVGFFTDPEFPEWEDVQFAGRTDKAVIPKPLMEYLEDTFTPGLFIDADLKDVMLFGEGYGPGIQGGGKYRSDHSFVLFDVKIGDWWLKRSDVNDIASKLGIDSVPVIGRGTLENAVQIVSKGRMLRGAAWFGNDLGYMKSTWGDFEAEGIVAVPAVPMFDRKGDRIITKIKAKDFR